MDRETCLMKRDLKRYEALPTIRLKSSLQTLRTDSQRLAKVTKEITV
jgi:hypothetical protein